MRQCGQEINRLTNIINNNIVNYYNIVKSIPNKAWTGDSANTYVNNILASKKSTLELLSCIKAEGDLIINYASKIDSKISGLKR